MIAFDDVLPMLNELFEAHGDDVKKISPLIVNRDLNGRVRLILDENVQENLVALEAKNALVQSLCEKLASHCFPPERMVLFEPLPELLERKNLCYRLEGYEDVFILERLATETNWAQIEPVVNGAISPRIVFFSIKGGVGRSTAIAATAYSLAQRGKRVMVLDLDLESPGLSSSLLPEENRPAYGITDWLVEDLLDNGENVFENMVASSTLAPEGEIYVVPAHGQNPGEYISKLGRAWMPKIGADGAREPWPGRLRRLLDVLEKRYSPEVILIDSRAGIDEVASACVTDLGAKGILLFSLDSDQAWSGYRTLFHHWLRMGVVHDIRDRLQLVGAMIPETGRDDYFKSLLENSWNIFAEELYDAVPPEAFFEDFFSFDLHDEGAPHYPWPVRWHRGFAALQSLHSRFQQIDDDELRALFGPLIEGVLVMIADGDVSS